MRDILRLSLSQIEVRALAKRMISFSKRNSMARIAIVVGGAIINATTFVGGSFLAKYLIGNQNSVEEERKRHVLVVEKYQAAYEKY